MSENEDQKQKEKENRITKQADATKKWEDAQRTAFTYWINTMLARRNTKIDDLMTGFQDGVKIILLSEVLVGKAIEQRYVEKPKLKAHKINNTFIALKFLQDVGGVKGLTVSAENLVSPEFLPLLLGFCWQLLKHFQEPPDFDDDDDDDDDDGEGDGDLQWTSSKDGGGGDGDLQWSTSKGGTGGGEGGDGDLQWSTTRGAGGKGGRGKGGKGAGGGGGAGAGGKGKDKKKKKGKANSYESRLLNWVKTTLADKPGINIDLSNGFKSDGFRNGTALLGLIHEFDNDLVDYSTIDPNEAHVNCTNALSVAQEKMNIPSIIDGIELAEGNVGDKQLVLYLSLLYNAFMEKNKEQSVDTLLNKIKERESHLRDLKDENLKLKEGVQTITISFENLHMQYEETKTNHSNLSQASKETQEKLTSLKEEWSSSQEQWQEEITRLKSQMAAMMEQDDLECQTLQNQWDQSQTERDKLREELKKAKEQLIKEKEELEAKNRRLLQNEKRARKMKEELQDIISSQNNTFNTSIEDFRKHFIIHMRDMNTWRPYLEEDRDYDGKPTNLPNLESLSSKAFVEQVSECIHVARADNRTLQELLGAYEVETAEVVSVTIGKKQKRTQRYAWEQEFPEDMKAAFVKAIASPRGPPSPRGGAPSSPRSKGKEKTNRKRAEGGIGARRK